MLASFPDDLRVSAMKQLKDLGVEVRTGVHATNLSDAGLQVGDEFIPCRVKIWAAGNNASSLGKSLGVPVDKVGRVLVNDDLSVPGFPEIQVIGDLANFLATLNEEQTKKKKKTTYCYQGADADQPAECGRDGVQGALLLQGPGRGASRTLPSAPWPWGGRGAPSGRSRAIGSPRARPLAWSLGADPGCRVRACGWKAPARKAWPARHTDRGRPHFPMVVECLQ